jgi:zinc ribbon protein
MTPALEFVIAIVVAAGAVWFTLQPILRPAAVGDPLGDLGDTESDEFEEDTSPRAVALRALREIEFDRATGKLTDADYESLKTKYTAEAVAALRAGVPDGPTPAARRSAGGASSGAATLACPVHGPRPEADAAFCAQCGRRLGGGSGTGFCSRCGAELSEDATFCNRCGTRVAA